MPALLHPARLPRPALLVTALLLSACGGEAPPPVPAAAPAPPTEAAPAAAPAARQLDTAALKARAAASLAANRLYAPAGDNAVEDYLELRERLGTEPAVETALVDLAPYVVIGSEQAMAAGAFDEAERLLGLLQRMDAEAPALPRLREALAQARSEAERLAAERAEAERRAAEAAARQPRPTETVATAPVPAATAPAPAPPPASAPARAPAAASGLPAPAPAALPATPAPGTASREAPASPPPAPAPGSAAAAPRALLSRVPPRFPEAAQRRRLEGEVELLLTIAADGSVEGVDVLRAEPPGVFDREAVLAARRWRYAPAEGRSTARVVLTFRRPD
ncbi:energy transducer TonB [Silanimonas lenta]|uniref:energy transducer TonB n=1 Tax=Silanimonas lenta TaxID=265429 RepID=UPI0006840FB5|nr:energy transducer TonB [Silanimonas lenta]